jgi:microcystin-dependent protein
MTDIVPPLAPSIGPIGEIRIFAGLVPPLGWLTCEGQTLPSAAYPELSKALGSTFGDATSFTLPDLRGRLPVAANPAAKPVPLPMGTADGAEAVALTGDQIPAHAHGLSASASAATTNVAGAGVIPAAMAAEVKGYYAPSGAVHGKPAPMAAAAIDPGPPAAPHPNLMPALALNFIIAATPDAWRGLTAQSYQDGCDVFVGEVRPFAFGYVPDGWAVCDSNPVSIDACPDLYGLIADTYGARQGTMMYLPDLGGRAVMGAGAGPNLTPRRLGETSGAAKVALVMEHTPSHGHPLMTASAPGGATLAPAAGDWLGDKALKANLFSDAASPPAAMTGAVAVSGGGKPHENRQPYIAVNYCIALRGRFPFPT